jgi:hypothetical protein
VKGLEKITNVRLAEILSQEDVVATDKISDALFMHDQTGEPFTDIIISAGYVAEWDLARIVAEHFQLPFLLASTYQISRDALKLVPEDLLFQHNFLPLDVFDGLLTLTMPVLLSAETLDDIQKRTQMDVFPCVGLASENKKVLSELFPNRKPAPAKTAGSQAGRNITGGAWQSLFDVADERVKKDIGSGKDPSDPATRRDQGPGKRKADAQGPPDAKDPGAGKPPPEGGIQQTPGRPGGKSVDEPKSPAGTDLFDLADELVKKDLGKKKH